MQNSFHPDDLRDIALTAHNWSTRASLSQAARTLARQSFTLAISLSEQEHPANHELSMLKAMISHLGAAEMMTR